MFAMATGMNVKDAPVQKRLKDDDDTGVAAFMKASRECKCKATRPPGFQWESIDPHRHDPREKCSREL